MDKRELHSPAALGGISSLKTFIATCVATAVSPGAFVISYFSFKKMKYVHNKLECKFRVRKWRERNSKGMPHQKQKQKEADKSRFTVSIVDLKKKKKINKANKVMKIVK